MHVEIFLGGSTGEETIAAREPRGVVSIFDTYKFESSNYHSIIYRFKSIDTWLKGIHRTFCKEHLWHEEANLKNKFSLFNVVEDAEEKIEENNIKNNEKTNENNQKPDINGGSNINGKEN